MATGKWPVEGGGGGGAANLVEIPNDGALPGFDDGKIYITTDKGILYRWVDGGWNSYVAYTEYDTAASEAGHLPGRLTWDNVDKTLKLDTGFTDVSIQIGQELQTVVYNNTGSLIANGKPVYGSGADATNDRLTVALSQSNSFLSLRTVGVTTQDIANGSTGAITTHGIVRDIDLSAFSVGDPLWIDETVAGGYRNTKPAAPNYSIIIGTVLDNSASGILLVDFRIGSTLAASSDVDITGLSDRDILQYDASTFTWKNVLNSPLQTVIGMSDDKPDITLRENAGTVYIDLEKDGGGDILYFFQSGNISLNCTTGGGAGGKATVALTAGASSSSPQTNYVYVLDVAGTATLTASTTFPTGEFCWVGTVAIPDATTFLASGPYSFQRYSDSVEFTAERGALSYERERIRQIPPAWDSGVQATTAITTNAGVPDDVYVGTTSGVVYQMHRQNFPVFISGASDFYVANDSVAPYKVVTDLADLLTDATGASMSARRFSFVLWGAINKSTGDCKLFINLPVGTYNTDVGAVTDPDNFAVTSIPTEFRGTGFLIARLVYRHQTNSGGTWTNIAQSVSGVNNIDLRGLTPGYNLGGASTPSVNEFSDDVFRINDNIDPTKQLAFESSGITTGTTRTLTSPDKNGTLALKDDVITPLYSYKTTDFTIDDDDLIRTVGAIASASNVTITLPLAANNTDRIITVKKLNDSVGDVIVDGNGTETIEGELNYRLTSKYAAVTLQSDGTEWFIISKREKDTIFVQTLTGDYTVDDDDNLSIFRLFIGNTDRTINLPLASNNIDRTLTVIKGDSGSGVLTIDGNGTETINGDLTKSLFSIYDALTIHCDGSNWFIVGEFSTPPSPDSLIVEIKTADFTVVDGYWYLVDTTSGPVTATISNITGNNVFRVSDYAKNFGTNSCTLVADASDTIDGASQFVLRDDNAWCKCAGTTTDNQWVVDRSVIAGNGAVVSEWESYDGEASITGVTTDPTFGTTSVSSHKRRIGENMEIYFRLRQTTAGTAGSGTYLWTVPDGLTIDTTRVSVSASTARGTRIGDASASSSGSIMNGFMQAYDNNQLLMVVGNETLSLTQISSSFQGADNSVVDYTFKATIPILEWAGTGTTNLNADALSRTKSVALSVTGDNGYSDVASEGQVYIDSQGDPRLAFNINGAKTNGTGLTTITIAGVQFPAQSQAVSGCVASPFANADISRAKASTSGDIEISSTSVHSNVFLSGDIRLAAIPTDAFVGADSNFSTFAEALEKNPAVGVEGCSSKGPGLLGQDTSLISGKSAGSIASNLDVTDASILTYSSSGSITGLSGGVRGQRIRLYGSTSSGQVKLLFNDAGGTQKFLSTESKDITLNGYASTDLYCDGTYWFVSEITPNYQIETGTMTTSTTGYTINTSYDDWTAIKIGNTVTLKFRVEFTTSGTPDSVPIIDFGMSSEMQPSNQGSSYIVPIYNGSSYTSAVMHFNENANLWLYRSVSYSAWVTGVTGYTGHSSATLGDKYVTISYIADN